MSEVAGEKIFKWSDIFLHVLLGFGSLLQLPCSYLCPGLILIILVPCLPCFMLTGKKRSLVGKFPVIVMLAPLT